MKKRFYKKLVYCFLYIGVLSICKYASVSEVKHLKLGLALNVDHPMHLDMEYLANVVSKKSLGNLQIEIYPNQQLATERQCLEMLQTGSLEMTKVSAEVLENFERDSKVMSLPFLYKDGVHIYKILNGKIGREIFQHEEDDYWLKGLAYYEVDQSSFYSKKEIVSTTMDRIGQKCKTQENSEVVIAVGTRNHEMYPYNMVNEHTSAPDLLMISTAAWNSLTRIEQQWLQEAAEETEKYQYDQLQEVLSQVQMGILSRKL